MNKRSGHKTRSHILETARRIFSEQNYSAASMRSIARAAAISVGCLYIHFKNKEELYLTLMQSSMDDLNQRTLAELKDITDPRKAIETFISLSINHARTHRAMILLQGRELDSFGLERKQRFFRERRQCIAGIIRDGIEKGFFQEADPEEVARIIFNAIRGFVMSMVIDEEALFLPEECSRLLLNGLLRRNS